MSSNQDNVEISDRAQSVLKGLITKYIDDGHPVGSRTLSKEAGLSLSSATIRNVMADLEDCGLINSPHTSAGRVPTVKGYRFFINTILQSAPLNNKNISALDHHFDGIADRKSILTGATEILSQITSFAGIVSAPSNVYVNIRQIEFLKLSEKKVLVILVTEDGQVQNKVLPTHSEYSESELTEATNFFNEQYVGKELEAVRSRLLSKMYSDRKDMHKEMRTAIDMAGQLFSEEDNNQSDSVLVSGENNLLAVPEFSEIEKLRQLFDSLKTKQVLFDLLQKSMFAEGINIFIGEESGYEPFKDCSVIAAPYKVDNTRVGVLGVIGPTRMQYDEVISAVDITAKLVGSTLSLHNVQ